MNAVLERLAASADQRPFLNFMRQDWTRARLWDEAGRAAGGLVQKGFRPGEPLALFLPNLPVAVVALLAAWRAGLTPALVDARKPRAQLEAWQEKIQAGAFVTLDLASVADRIPFAEERQVFLAKMSTQLLFWPRLLSPWLRGGAPLKPGVGEVWWHELTGQPPPLPPAPALLLADGKRLTEEKLLALAKPLQGRHLLALPLAEEKAIGWLLGAWFSGGQIVLSPRLDEKALKKVARAAHTESVLA